MLQPYLNHRARGRRPHADPSRFRTAALGALIALTAIGAAGCGGDDGGSRQAGGTSKVAFKSCDRTFELDRAPQRVVITNDAIADTLFALGVGERIVAKTRGESAPSPELKERLASLPNLGTRSPSTEALIAAKPELLITDQVEKVSGDNGSPSVEELKRLGVATYVAGGCSADLSVDSPGLDSLFADLKQLGTVFGVQEPAQALADKLRARLDDVSRRTSQQTKPGVVEVSQVAGQLYVTSGGYGTDVIERAGGTNLFADLPGQYAPISPEQIIARNPQAIIAVDYTASPAGQRELIEFLTQKFPTTDAVKNRRLLAIDAAKTGARGSTRPVDGVVEIARFLHPTAFRSQ
ncbi:iron complex transport system substrate-binding protein [Sinosporangium album]|uniref:Iron complex transport system substrate-binding protein n=1 Tax=Sinosporangium album TaxID=504805 RepID=A0A1G8K3E2_9ACTN|nr:ABC transporter substrate-binding protein [Sinosporangium album]SDI37954.1 iron complex transport system substrate-binding protein [Sinosporangium album]